MPEESSQPENSAATAALDGSRVCVTGGAGFIGSALARRLLEIGARVTIIDDLSGSDMGAIADLLDDFGDQLDFLRASVLEPAALSEAVGDASVVFHLAAVSAAGVSLAEPSRVFEVNAAGTQRVLEAARLASVSRFVYAGSCSAYGAHAPPHTESMAPDPLSPYAASKLAGEHAARAYSRSMGLPTAVLRFFNVYGPGQSAESEYAAVVPIFIDRLLRGDRAVLHGAGDQTRDFIYVADVVRALLLAAGKTEAGPLPINIGAGAETSIRELAALIARLLDRDPADAFQTAPARKGDVPASRADLSRARQALGFEPRTSLEEGLRRTIASRRGGQEPDPINARASDAR
jgi:UDP-glucose 4-epimerase